MNKFISLFYKKISIYFYCPKLCGYCKNQETVKTTSTTTTTTTLSSFQVSTSDETSQSVPTSKLPTSVSILTSTLCPILKCENNGYFNEELKICKLY